jgi:S-formylglutathione hydrolase FrmB
VSSPTTRWAYHRLASSGLAQAANTRRFRDALCAKGNDVTYTEVPDGNHGLEWWRPRLAEGIVLLSADPANR